MTEKELAEIQIHISAVERCGVEGVQREPVDTLTDDAWDLIAEIERLKRIATYLDWCIKDECNLWDDATPRPERPSEVDLESVSKLSARDTM